MGSIAYRGSVHDYVSDVDAVRSLALWAKRRVRVVCVTEMTYSEGRRPNYNTGNQEGPGRGKDGPSTGRQAITKLEMASRQAAVRPRLSAAARQ